MARGRPCRTRSVWPPATVLAPCCSSSGGSHPTRPSTTWSRRFGSTGDGTTPTPVSIWWARRSPSRTPTPSSGLCRRARTRRRRPPRRTSHRGASWPPGMPMPTCSCASPSTRGSAFPLLEAMRSDLPIVALAAGAVPETMGDAGLLLDDARPSNVAMAIDRLRRDDELARRLVDAGRRRLRHFAATATRARFVELLSSVAATARPAAAGPAAPAAPAGPAGQAVPA